MRQKPYFVKAFLCDYFFAVTIFIKHKKSAGQLKILVIYDLYSFIKLLEVGSKTPLFC